MTNDLAWLLDKFREDCAGAEHVLLLSKDGLRHSWDASLRVDDADRLAAIVSAVLSLAHSADKLLAGGGHTRSVVIELLKKQLLLLPASEGSLLCVTAPADADPGVIGGKMHALIERLSEHLEIAPRATETRAP